VGAWRCRVCRYRSRPGATLNSFNEVYARCETVVGKAYEKVAKDSCAAACAEVVARNERDPQFREKVVPENQYSIENNLPTELVGADVSIDAGWHGRSSVRPS
jgi:hypothetical protein